MFVTRVFSVFCVVLLAVQSGEEHVRNFVIIHIYIYIYMFDFKKTYTFVIYIHAKSNSTYNRPYGNAAAECCS